MKINIKKEKTKNKKEESVVESTSELRQDIVTKDWVVIATGRSKRPEDFIAHEGQRLSDDISSCFFCDPDKSGQEKDVLIYADSDNDWTLRVFPNKYPALLRGKIARAIDEGPYHSLVGSGYHEIFVTRDHYRHIHDLAIEEIAEVFDAFRDRYLTLMGRKNVNFISIFHNYKKEAGASISHPHSQLVGVPVISPYIKLELDGAESYHKSNKKCVYCLMAEYEREEQKRVVFENDMFIAFCPFASRAAFEIWIMPKKHSPYFERITDIEKIKLAEAFKRSVGAIKAALGNPPYNFYIHTSPCDGRQYSHYHWHIEILPRTATWAGFELETGIEISTIKPETSAEYLRTHI